MITKEEQEIYEKVRSYYYEEDIRCAMEELKDDLPEGAEAPSADTLIYYLDHSDSFADVYWHCIYTAIREENE